MKSLLLPYFSTRRLGAWIILACMLAPFLVHGKDKEEVYVQAGEYKLVTITSEDGQMGGSCLYKRDKRIDCNEDTFALLKQCDDRSARETLMREFARREIREAGGVEKYQKGIDANIKRFGADFYGYLEPEAKKFYTDEGLRFEPAKGVSKVRKD